MKQKGLTIFEILIIIVVLVVIALILFFVLIPSSKHIPSPNTASEGKMGLILDNEVYRTDSQIYQFK